MYIVTAQEMYDIEKHAMEEIGLSSTVLMANAGRAISHEIQQLAGKADKILVLIGPGNNGGDGFVIAMTLLHAGYCVTAVQAAADDRVKGDALHYKDVYLNSGGRMIQPADPETIRHAVHDANLIVDALLGIGSTGEVKEPIAWLIQEINQAACPVAAVDIPSGLPADEGFMPVLAVKADYTFMLGACKMSAFVPETASYYGEWKLLEIGLPPVSLERHGTRQLTQASQVKDALPERSPFSHKGTYGKCLIIGGSRTMPGSVAMSARAALRTGAGLAVVGTAKDAIPVIAASCLEATYAEIRDEDGLLVSDPHLELEGYRAIAIGPGLGRHSETARLVRQVFREAACPLVMDADALYHGKSLLQEASRRPALTVITPHPGEMGMLLDLPAAEVIKSPFSISRQYAEQTGAYVILKGKHTIITSPDGRQYVNTTGNPGMAKGGSGDVLTGIVLTQVMQQPDPLEALAVACFLHGKSADLLIERTHSARDLLASDTADGLSLVYRHFL